MNYERAIVYDFPRSGLASLYGGSSLNRKHNEQKKIDRRKKETETFCQDVYGDWEDTLLFSGTTGQLRRRAEESAEKRKRDPDKKHSLSSASGRKIRNKCAAFFSTAARAFVTLTFIQDITDDKALNCLKQMLHGWRKEHGKDFNYLWVAERQQSGRIHFHIMVSTPMDIPRENARWIRIQYNQGLKLRSAKLKRDLERPEIERMIDNYYIAEKSTDPADKESRAITGFMDRANTYDVFNRVCAPEGKKYVVKNELQSFANSFDIEYINSQYHLSYYLTKYVTKTANNEDRTEFDFLPWQNSRRMSRIFTDQLIIPELFFDAISDINTVVTKKSFVRKKTGEVVDPGTVIWPTVHKNDWSMSVNILNRGHYNSFLWDMKEINKRILNDGYCPDIIEYDQDHYFNDYCRSYTPEDFEILKMKNIVPDEILQLAGATVQVTARAQYEESEYYGLDPVTGNPRLANKLYIDGQYLNPN